MTELELEKLNNWCKKNHISLSVLNTDKERLVLVNGIEGFYLAERKRIFTLDENDLIFTITPIEKEQDVKIYIFEFGGIFCYVKKGDYINPKINELRYLGEKENEISYINLGINGSFAIGEGCFPYNDWVQKAKFLGHKYLGICEKSLSGALEFQNACLS